MCKVAYYAHLENLIKRIINNNNNINTEKKEETNIYDSYYCILAIYLKKYARLGYFHEV